MIPNNMYSNKKVFITGHSGFKGSWLTALLLNLGANVKGYSTNCENKHHYDILKLNKHIEDIDGDVRDRDNLTKHIKEFNPDLIFHLAAQPLVRRSYKNPAYTFETNAMGTMNVLEACRSFDFEGAMVFITTDKVYRNQEWDWGYRECDELWGNEPYSASKVCAEQIIDSYKQSYFFLRNVLIAKARAGNVIGGGDWGVDRLFTDIMRSYRDKKSVTLRNPDSTRPYQFVLDCCYGYLLLGEQLMQKKEITPAYNFSTNENMSVINVLREVNKYCAVQYGINIDMLSPKEFNLLNLDSTLAKKELNWKPKYDIPQAIEKTVTWYNEYFDNDEVITMRQIDDYLR